MNNQEFFALVLFIFTTGVCKAVNQSQLSQLMATVERLELKIQEMDDRINNKLREMQRASSQTQDLCTLMVQNNPQDECIKARDNCSPNAACKDLPIGYNCTCLPGFEGDGFDCEDIDECATGVHNCQPDNDCINTEGHYTCKCPIGYVLNDEYSCEAHPCDSPSVFMEGLGCIIPVEMKQTWFGAKLFCQDIGARLLEGITTRDQIFTLHEHFQPLNFPFIGFYNGEWSESKVTISSSSDLLMRYAVLGSDCGAVYLKYEESLGINNRQCGELNTFLCQKI